jgi:hypothetical protein
MKCHSDWQEQISIDAADAKEPNTVGPSALKLDTMEPDTGGPNAVLDAGPEV